MFYWMKYARILFVTLTETQRNLGRGIISQPLLEPFRCHEALREPLILLDLVGTKLYCFRATVHCYHCLYIIFSANPVRRSEEFRGGRNLVM